MILLAFLVVPALVVAFLGFAFVTSMIERQYLSGDLEPVSQPYPYTPSPYWLATGQDARQLALKHCGDFGTKKGASIVKGLQSFWVTEDSLAIVAIISAGAVKKSLVRSRLNDGQIIESSDYPSSST